MGNFGLEISRLIVFLTGFGSKVLLGLWNELEIVSHFLKWFEEYCYRSFGNFTWTLLSFVFSSAQWYWVGTVYLAWCGRIDEVISGKLPPNAPSWPSTRDRCFINKYDYYYHITRRTRNLAPGDSQVLSAVKFQLFLSKNLMLNHCITFAKL